jgi:hypothetical protein
MSLLLFVVRHDAPSKANEAPARLQHPGHDFLGPGRHADQVDHQLQDHARHVMDRLPDGGEIARADGGLARVQESGQSFQAVWPVEASCPFTLLR